MIAWLRHEPVGHHAAMLGSTSYKSALVLCGCRCCLWATRAKQCCELCTAFLCLQVLEELDVGHIPMISVWNKVDVCADSEMVQTVASKRDNTVCISAHTGEGLPDLMNLVQHKIEQSMMPINVLVPYAQVSAKLSACCELLTVFPVTIVYVMYCMMLNF